MMVVGFWNAYNVLSAHGDLLNSVILVFDLYRLFWASDFESHWVEEGTWWRERQQAPLLWIFSLPGPIPLYTLSISL
jgi:hypothetical protein